MTKYDCYIIHTHTYARTQELQNYNPRIEEDARVLNEYGKKKKGVVLRRQGLAR